MSSECVFCDRIERGEYEATRIEGVVRFEPLNPVTPGHMLFIPTRHVDNAAELPELTGDTFYAAADWAQDEGEEFNLITSTGRNATQSIWHLHVHYVPRGRGDGLTLPWTGQRLATPTGQED